MKEFIYNISDIQSIAKKIIPLLRYKVILLEGTMGMGKTTLVSALVKELGISDKVSSPTFSLVNHYKNDTTNIFHFDFYRIKNSQEAINFGVEEYLYSDNFCFLEWSEHIKDLLPEHTHSIKITFLSEQERKVVFY